MNIEANITISIEGGPSFTFTPDMPQWDEAVGLLCAYYTPDQLTGPMCISNHEAGVKP
jgi:hypothetical protein